MAFAFFGAESSKAAKRVKWDWWNNEESALIGDGPIDFIMSKVSPALNQRALVRVWDGASRSRSLPIVSAGVSLVASLIRPPRDAGRATGRARVGATLGGSNRARQGHAEGEPIALGRGCLPLGCVSLAQGSPARSGLATSAAPCRFCGAKAYRERRASR